MSKSISAMGKSVDMSAIRSRNEKVRAVGNMQVNARGDLIDSSNNVVAQASQRVNRVYSKATANPTAVTKAAPVVAQPVQAPAPQIQAPAVQELAAAVTSQEELKMFEEIDADFVKPEIKSKKR